jgi:hypothetical protein
MKGFTDVPLKSREKEKLPLFRFCSVFLVFVNPQVVHCGRIRVDRAAAVFEADAHETDHAVLVSHGVSLAL